MSLPRPILSLAIVLDLALAGHAETRPNIVILFTDDQRADAVGYTGNKAIHTPHLDQLAHAGLIFDQCFVNTSICAVSRANLISGQYPSRHGIDDFHKTFSKGQLEQSVPSRLQKAGYQTAFFGKWGIGDSAQKTAEGAAVFDYWAGQPMQTCFFHEPDCRYVGFDGFKRPLDDLCDCPADAAGKEGYRNRIGSDTLTDPLHVDSQITPKKVAHFLDGRDEQKPFCMMVFFKAPHSPFTDWDPEVRSITAGRRLPAPAAATLENAAREPDVIKQSLGWPSGQAMLKKHGRLQAHMRDYYRLVSSMDLGVGRIMTELRTRGLAENTVILFTSDNGHFLAEHGLAGKWLMYEPSLRVPGFLHDPRAEGGKRSDRLVITTDFSVTMLALAGLDIPPDMTGRDLTPLLTNPSAPWRKDFYYDHPYTHRGAIPRTMGVRTETHTYTRYPDSKPPFEQLVDLRSDPDQLDNLATHPEHAPLLKSLRQRSHTLAKEVGPR